MGSSHFFFLKVVVFLLNNPEFWTGRNYKGWTIPEKFYYVNKSWQAEKRKGSINEGLITEINQINIFFLFSPQFPGVGKKKH